MTTMKREPQLRFPGFEEKWEEKSLGELVEYRNGKSYEKNVCSTGDYKLISLNSLDSNGKLKKNQKRVNIADEFLTKNDIIMVLSDIAMGNFLGLTDVIPEDSTYVLNQRMAGLKPKDSVVSKWLSECINFNQKYFKCHGQGTSQLNLSKGDVLNFKLETPSLPEQQKIAECLTAMDESIESQQQKVEQLKAYKKGLLQQIFSQSLRFPGFEGEWKAKRLGEIVVKKQKGNTPNYEKPVNLLLNNEFMENKEQQVFVSDEVNVKKEDILILWDGSQAGKVYTGFEGVLGSTFTSIGLKEGNSNLFVFNLLTHNIENIQRVWREGSGIPHVAKDFIDNFKIMTPPLSEQQKIADCLSTLDELIELENQKLEQLRQYKKGLLQQLFV